MSVNVSVIISCYNCARTLDETLECLERQTYKDFEVICVNDGSLDSTLEMLNTWKAKDTLNLVIIDKPNTGVSSTRNMGVANAQGEYILFLDSDDVYHDNFIHSLITSAEKYEADISYCKLNKGKTNVFSDASSEPQWIKKDQSEAMNDLLFRMGNFGFCCFLYRKSVISEINLEFEVDTRYGEDREYIWKYLCHCKSAVLVDESMYWYRINPSSATQKSATWRRTDSLSAVKRVEAYLKENNCDFYKTYCSYMYARAMWSIAKSFAVSGDKQLFDRLRKEYDVKTCMKRTAKDSNKLVKLASWMYLVHPSLFFRIVGLKK